MSLPADNHVTVQESGNGPYGQLVTIGHHVIGADEPENLGGRDSGPSPYQFLMAGLGACTTMTMRMYAARHGWPLEKASVFVRHHKIVHQDGRPPIDTFERVIHLTGPLSDQQRIRLLEIADKCPVSETLQRNSVVRSKLAGAGSESANNSALAAQS